ncbi:transposase domain-containing protein [Rhizophagus clarus]|uniref:Transposase domain-containing protein n=1 Tax=Rhizophagus clarus TaxID=94130 RepID=A0A8H3M7K0_9GLOM|nr:transposase domain-containing protein [Rhizophagus clarus]
MSDSEDLEETDDDFGFENEENNNYENDSISDFQNESEFDNADNINFNTDNEEDSMIISDELLEGLRLLYVKSNFNFSEAAFNNIYKVFNRNKMSFNKIKKILGSIKMKESVNFASKEDRYYSNGKSRKNLPSISIIERLKLQFKNSKRSEELLYRYNYTNNIGDLVHGNISDIFDGQIYKELLDNGYFPNPIDIAFTASCDGLKQPQDFNSFLYPLIQEMKMLQGHNSYSGCRFCNLQGTLNEMNRHVYYPLQQGIDLKQLPIQTHNEMLISTNEIEHLKGDHRETHIRNCGKFYPKNDERNSNNYTISSKTWVEIGEIMEKNRSNIPFNIGRLPRNIVKHSVEFKAVEWTNWIILFSLPLLKGRLPQSSYGLKGERLPAYLISFHYLLHIGDCIEDLGPYCEFWQFLMERYCGMLIPLVSSRKLPYVNLFNNVLLQERFKYLQLLPKYDEKVFSNFKEKEKTWPPHRDIEESYIKYGKLRTKDGNIISSKW